MGVAVRNEGANVNSNINVTPMVDVMLVLLIIFMVITPMLQNKVNVDLAKVDNPTSMPDADKEDAIIVADLTNTTGEPVFDGTLRQALAVKLEESPFMNVVSDQKMNTMLGLTGHPPPTTVTPELAREICIRSGGRVIVTGSIARVGGAISLDASIRGVRNWRHDGRS